LYDAVPDDLGWDADLDRGMRMVDLPFHEVEPRASGPGRYRAPRRSRAAVAWAAAAAIAVAALAPATDLVTARPDPAARSAGASAGVTAGTVTFAGSGFGHGVGMSQYGARGMALAGADVRQILTHYYSGTTVAAYPDKVDVRVNVVHRAAGVRLAGVPLATGGGALTVLPVGGPALAAAPGDVVTVRTAGRLLAIAVQHAGGGIATATATGAEVRWSGGRRMPGPASLLAVASTSSSGGNPLNGKLRRYRWGSLVLTALPSGTGARVDAVAVVDLHSEYLRGIGEMPSSWPVEALKTQVVAARNYALREVAGGVSAACGGCHLWDDTRSQVYAGWSKEAEGSFGRRWVAAMLGTQTSAGTGLAVLYQGSPITTYYSSSTGGRSRSAARVWGNAAPYLVSVSDPWSVDPAVNRSFAAWHRTASVARVLAVFGLPDLVSIRVSAKDESGAALRVTAKASDGSTATLTGGRVRQRFGLPAEWITGITLPGGTPPPATSPSPTAPSPTATGGGSTTSAGRAGPPLSMVRAGTPVVFYRSGTRQAAGRTWRTVCSTTAQFGYRCAATYRGTEYRRNAAGLWGPAPAWILERVSYFDTVGPQWSGNLRASRGLRTVSGVRFSTSCDRGTGARLCTTKALVQQVGRRRQGTGYHYYRYPAWKVSSQVTLTALD
jgi:SpoIID/LytB domain protein